MTSSRQTSITTKDELQSSMIDGLKFVMACLVVMIHVGGDLFSESFTGVYSDGLFDTIHTLFAQGICRVAVPSFFLISGFLFFNNLKSWNWTTYKNKEIRRLQSLAIPYVAWNIIAIIVFIFVKHSEQLLLDRGEFNLYDFFSNEGTLRMLWDCNGVCAKSTLNILGIIMYDSFPFNGPLWFIRDLFIVTLLSPIIFWMITHLKKIFIVISGVLMAFNIWIPLNGFSANAFFFFSLGAYIRLTDSNLMDFFIPWRAVAITLSILALSSALICNGQHLLFYDFSIRVFTLFGTASVFLIARRITLATRFRVSHTLAQSSFFIFAMQRIFVIAGAAAITKFILPIGSNDFVFILQYFITTFITILICVSCYVICRRLLPKTLMLLTGGRG